MKVLMVGNHSSNKGGMTSVITQLLEYDWKKCGVDMNFIPTFKPGSVIAKSLFFAWAYLKIIVFFVIKKPDVVHMHMSCRGSFTRKYFIHCLCKKFGIKDIIHLHGSEFKDWYIDVDNKTKEKVKTLLKEANVFFVLGEKWKHVIYEIEPKTNIVVLSNTVSIPKETVAWDAKSCKFLYLGVLIKRKGLNDLLNAIKILKDENNIERLHFIIAGVGEEEDNLKKQCRTLGLDGLVSFVGWISGDEKKKLIMKCQYAVLPSYNEGLPISILESISYGMPVISTNVGDITAAVHENKNGFLVLPGDTISLADRIVKASNKNIFELMSKYSKKLSYEKFSDEHYFETIIKCY